MTEQESKLPNGEGEGAPQLGSNETGEATSPPSSADPVPLATPSPPGNTNQESDEPTATAEPTTSTGPHDHVVDPGAASSQATAEPEPPGKSDAKPSPEEDTQNLASDDAKPDSTDSQASKTPRPTPATIPPPSAIAPPPSAMAAPRPASAPGASPETQRRLDPADVEAASQFGKVAADGTVSVVESAGERVVGQYPGVAESEALSLYIRRFLDLKAQVNLFQTRLQTLSARDLDSGLAVLEEALKEPAAVGDLDSLRQTVEQLRDDVTERKKTIAKEREAARKEALVKRTHIVEQAEAIAAADPQNVQWRQQGDKLRGLLGEWKTAQRSGARFDKATEDALWKRFSEARSTFDRNRRQFFAELDAQHADAKAAKEKLIERAEALQHSTDWGPTSAAYRGLMDEWKATGRAARKDDDALWARFRSAQDVFFQARQVQNEALDAEYEENLKVKLALLDEAEKLLPIKNLKSTKTALRNIQDRWDEAGRVPRAHMKQVESRLRAVEQAVKHAESNEWQRSDPQLQERAEGAASQLQAAIASLEEDLKKAEAGGDERKVKQARDALDARKAWLAQVMQVAQEGR